MTGMPAKKPLRCRLGFHHWEDAQNEDGERFSLCTRCATTKDKVVFLDSPGGMA